MRGIVVALAVGVLLAACGGGSRGEQNLSFTAENVKYTQAPAEAKYSQPEIRSRTEGATALASQGAASAHSRRLCKRGATPRGEMQAQPNRCVFPGGCTKAGQATFVFQNKDPIEHYVVIDELGLEVEAHGGQTARKMIALKPGTYTYYCKVPGHRQAGMEGKLVVR